jgi:hypothetical protein
MQNNGVKIFFQAKSIFYMNTSSEIELQFKKNKAYPASARPSPFSSPTFIAMSHPGTAL